MRNLKKFNSQSEAINYVASTPFVSTIKGQEDKYLIASKADGDKIKLVADESGFISFEKGFDPMVMTFTQDGTMMLSSYMCRYEDGDLESEPTHGCIYCYKVLYPQAGFLTVYLNAVGVSATYVSSSDTPEEGDFAPVVSSGVDGYSLTTASALGKNYTCEFTVTATNETAKLGVCTLYMGVTYVFAAPYAQGSDTTVFFTASETPEEVWPKVGGSVYLQGEAIGTITAVNTEVDWTPEQPQ